MAASARQRAILWLAVAAGIVFVAIQLAPPLADYLHSPYAALLKSIASASYIGLIGVAIILSLLGRFGIIPSTPVAQSPVKSGGGLKNLALWIVVALVLVLFFNLVQGQKDGRGPMSDNMANLLINWLPMMLIVGVWIFFLVRMNAKKRKDLDGGSN